MDVEAFVRAREDSWKRLETVLAAASRRLEKMPASELAELSDLYRQATSDLALARRDYPRHAVVGYLNQLVGHGHAILYRSSGTSWHALRRYFTREVPQLYRRMFRYMVTGAVLFWLPAIISFTLTWRFESVRSHLLGEAVDAMTSGLESGRSWAEIAPSEGALAAGAIMTNNVQVIFVAFAGGITLGLLTIVILALNGVFLGSVFGSVTGIGYGHVLFDFVAAHGPVELSVVYVAGGCGLYMADAIVRPGLLTRSSALARNSIDAVKLMLGCVPLLIGAGLVEGYLSPSGAPLAIKVGVGVISGIAVHAYWLLMGRGAAVEPSPTRGAGESLARFHTTPFATSPSSGRAPRGPFAP